MVTNTENKITALLGRVYSIQEAYQLGYEWGLKGGTLKKIDFRIFSTPENTVSWEKGKKAAEDSKRTR